MRAVLQRVRCAAVAVEGKTVGEIGAGFLVLLSVAEGDTKAQAALLAEKTANLRVFSDKEGKMNHSLLDTAGEALVVSNFTLYGDCRKGRRPYFAQAARPEIAEPLYQDFCKKLREAGVAAVKQGSFGAHMILTHTDDGPVTILLDSNELARKE